MCRTTAGPHPLHRRRPECAKRAATVRERSGPSTETQDRLLTRAARCVRTMLDPRTDGSGTPAPLPESAMLCATSDPKNPGKSRRSEISLTLCRAETCAATTAQNRPPGARAGGLSSIGRNTSRRHRGFARRTPSQTCQFLLPQFPNTRRNRPNSAECGQTQQNQRKNTALLTQNIAGSLRRSALLATQPRLQPVRRVCPVAKLSLPPRRPLNYQFLLLPRSPPPLPQPDHWLIRSSASSCASW